MAQIGDGVTPSQLLRVDASSGALRATEYGPDGQALAYVSNNDRGIASIRVRQSGTGAAPLVVWAIRNKTAGKTLYIRRFWLQLGFNGTGAATEMQYELIKGTGCTALTGATAVTPLLKRTAISNSDVDCGVLDTGITLTNVALGSAFWSAWMSRVTHSATQAGQFGGQHILDFSDQPIELLQNEVLAIRTVQTAVIGDIAEGGCEFFGG
jgi:hypothetical protein